MALSLEHDTGDTQVSEQIAITGNTFRGLAGMNINGVNAVRGVAISGNALWGMDNSDGSGDTYQLAGVSFGIALTDCIGVTITGNSFRWWSEGHTAAPIFGGALFIQAECDNINVAGNTFVDLQNISTSFPGFIQIGGSTADGDNVNIAIDGNVFLHTASSAGAGGIVVYFSDTDGTDDPADHVIISNNAIYGVRDDYAIQAVKASALSIIGNHIHYDAAATNDYAVWLRNGGGGDCANVSIVGNQFDMPSGSFGAILANGATDLLVAANMMHGGETVLIGGADSVGGRFDVYGNSPQPAMDSQAIFQLPVKSTTGDPGSPVDGFMYVNTLDNAIRVYADGAWRDLVAW
jgi:hypothetical protein